MSRANQNKRVPKTVKKPLRIRQYRFRQYMPGYILIAVLVVFLIFGRQANSNNKHDEYNGYEAVLLSVPARNIAKGERIGSKDFTAIKWNRTKLLPEHIIDIKDYEGTVSTTFLPKYMPVLRSAVSNTLDINAVVEGIPESMRAITVKVDAESAVEGWARSGNYVDVIVIKESRSGGPEAKVIAENVKILSAGRSAQGGTAYASSQLPATITVLVTQEDALKIKTAASIGKLTFALRGVTDNTPVVARNMNQESLLGIKLDDKAKIKGRATGPDGKKYILIDKGGWVMDRSSEL